MGNNREFMKGRVKQLTAPNELIKVISNIFEVVNQYGSSFAFSGNKDFPEKANLDSHVTHLKEFYQDPGNTQHHSNSSLIELNIFPVISKYNISGFQNFSTQLGELNPEWYVEPDKSQTLLNFISIWYKKESSLREDIDASDISNSYDQSKDLLIAYAKWQCFVPIADYLSQAITHEVTVCYSKDCELGNRWDKYYKLIDNAISNCIDVFPIDSSLDKHIAQELLKATTHSVAQDSYSKLIYVDQAPVASIAQAEPLLAFEDIRDSIAQDCQLVLGSKEYQAFNLTKLDCVLNWEEY